MIPKAKTKKAKINKRDFIKLKSFCPWRKSSAKWKGNLLKERKSCNHIADKRLLSKIYIDSKNSIEREQTVPILKGLRNLIFFPKKSWVSVQSLSHVQLFATPRIAACQTSLSINNSWSFLKLMFIESVMPSSHFILCRPLLLLPSIFPSIRVFSNESVLLIRWPKYWSFSFSISPSNEYSGLISFRMDWLDHLAIQGTLKSLLQHHSSKASIIQC